METNKILLEYACPDIKNLILEYAFSGKKINLFDRGYYERCEEILEEIYSLNINNTYKSQLFKFLFNKNTVYIGIFELIIEKCEQLDSLTEADWTTKLKTVCLQKTHFDLMCRKKKFKNWNVLFPSACCGGNMELVNFIIEKGGDDWNQGLKQAALSGNMELFKFLAVKRTMTLDGLKEAYRQNDRTKINYFSMST